MVHYGGWGLLLTTLVRMMSFVKTNRDKVGLCNFVGFPFVTFNKVDIRNLEIVYLFDSDIALNP